MATHLKIQNGDSNTTTVVVETTGSSGPAGELVIHPGETVETWIDSTQTICVRQQSSE